MPELAGLSMRCPALVMENVEWTAVEYSPISAAILAAMRPDIRVVQGSFESFVTKRQRAAWTSSPSSSNPPYGRRGDDQRRPKPITRTAKPMCTFLRRCLDALMALEYGCF